MPIQVVMPRLGESVDEGTISQWLKAEGEQVNELEPLLEVNTDKVDTEIPSPASGTLLKITAPEGTVAQAGMVIAWVGEPGEVIPDGEGPIQPAIETAPVAETPPADMIVEQTPVSVEPHQKEGSPGQVISSPGRHPELGFISPVVARMAAEHNLDLSKIPGTGADGRITKKDVENYLATSPIEPVVQTVSSATELPVPAPAIPQLAGELIPHDRMRRSIAEHMVNSKRTSPHVTTVMEVDLKKITEHRLANKAAFARDGVNLTFTAYFVAATISALKAYPIVNSSWTEEGIQLHRNINIGMAASLGEAGLIVPVIHNADTLSLLGLARSINDLAERARARQLKPDEVRGGTFTITNHGVSGSLFASPIINQPQCGILGVGMIQKRVVVVSDETGADAIAIRPMAYLSLTFDHRILDGAIADYFLGKVVESLQNWT